MALAERGARAGSLVGDVLALGAALSWAGIVLVLRLTSLKDVRLEVQLMLQLVVSAPILLLMARVRSLVAVPRGDPLGWAGGSDRGWLILGEEIIWQIWAVLALVAAGILLINRR